MRSMDVFLAKDVPVNLVNMSKENLLTYLLSLRARLSNPGNELDKLNAEYDRVYKFVLERMI